MILSGVFKINKQGHKHAGRLSEHPAVRTTKKFAESMVAKYAKQLFQKHRTKVTPGGEDVEFELSFTVKAKTPLGIRAYSYQTEKIITQGQKCIESTV